MTRRLTHAQARRVALAAQGLGRPRRAGVSLRRVQGEIDRVAQFQLDSVNVAVRAHLMPLFARLGPYDTALLERAWSRAPRRVFEYWGHAACLIDVNLEPALRLRKRARAERGDRRVDEILAAKPDLAARILGDLAEKGPLTAREIDNEEERKKVSWGWNWSEAKHVLEHLFDVGTVSVAGRNAQFERRYDLTGRVLPPAVLATPEPTDAEAHDLLVARAARAQGVADLTALSAYFYLRRDATRAAVARLVARGELEPVEVAGVPGDHWLWHEARRPRSLHAQALVSPFDSSVFERQRLERLFGARYRIEIYVPEAKREYGYYVYLFWFGDRPGARVDLKADRASGVLRVQSAWWEEGVADPMTVAGALASELHLMAGWLGLSDVAVAPRGSLAGTLASVV
ncbi:MAG TPA: winged helix-turn-helix domain-containing protein [Propionibacterium sp.]|nr:winged helix-turn-helix domain-containing protein [Propionibacterium sp.]